MNFELSIFDGFRFFLAGFDTQYLLQVKSKIVNEGGVVFDKYGTDCTHVIVHNLVYDDVVCVTARRDGKTVVSSLWLEHSFHYGQPAAASNVMYWPLRDLAGIPGADKFKISITGYEGTEREDIKLMVSLMGAELSKQLRADETTHLVCYKFEGDKYKLAKLKPFTKIVNHQWLKDCLTEWKLLPEEPYSTKSGYEISIMVDQAEDSEDETGYVHGKKNSWITNLQHEIGDAPNHFVAANQAPVPSRQYGISSSSIINDEMLRKSDLLSESRNVNDIHKQQVRCQKEQSDVDANTENAKGQTIGNQVVSDAPSTSGYHKDVQKIDRSNNSRKTLKKSNIPLHVRGDFGSANGSKSDSTSSSKTSARSRASLKPARNLGKANIDDVPPSNSCVDEEEATSLAVGKSSSKTLNNSVARKHSPLNLRDTSVSLKSAGKSSKVDETLDKGVAEKVIADVHTTNDEAGSMNENNLDAHALLPRKRAADGSKVFHDSIKSQKITTSASKRVDAQEPITPVSNPLEKTSGCNQIINESNKLSSGRSSNLCSAKSNAKNVASSRTLTFELPQGSKPTSTDVLVSPNGKCNVSTLSGKENKMGEPEYTHHGAASSGTNDLDGVKSGSPKLNSGEQTGSSVKKPPRMKMVARKTLGARSKLSKQGAEAQRSSASKNSSGDGVAVHQINQENREVTTRSGETLRVSVRDQSVRLGPRPNLRSGTDMIDCQKLVEEGINASSELEVNNQKDQAIDSVSDKISGQKMHRTIEMKQKLVPQKGDDSILHGAKSTMDTADTAKTTQGDVEIKSKSDASVCNGQGGDKVLTKPGKLAGKKRRGTLLLRKSKVPDEGNTENEPVIDGRSTEVGENVRILGDNQGTKNSGNCAGKLAGKKRHGTKVLNKAGAQRDDEKENELVLNEDENKKQAEIPTVKRAKKSNPTPTESNSELNSVKNCELKEVKKQSACFIVSGHRLQRKEFQQLIKRLKGKVCRDSHQWSYQATHFVVPDPVRRTEKFFAAAASGSWILKTDYLTASSQAGRLLPEEPYEWHKKGLTEDGAINLEAPRKWRLLRERTGHGAFYGMQIIIYGECIAPPLDTLKRVIKAGDGTILATSPPYTRFLESGVDYAIVSPGMPRVDIWVQEFLRHQIPCVLADYLVEYVCKPGYSLDRHVQYSTHEWAAKSFAKLLRLSEEVIIADAPSDSDITPDNQVSEDLACQVCGLTDREEVMLVCGDERGTTGCGIGTHIDCCDPPLEEVPEEDWFCPKCIESSDDFPGLSKGST